MAALGSALSSQLRAPAPTAWKGKKQARAKRATPVRAASTENKIEEVAAAVDPASSFPRAFTASPTTRPSAALPGASR